ncbi:MAG TPA: single-stranded-DNA-specific exonuclease RecJ [Gammaproteobacteria bacterium]|jgi:single-stranded-DNA-specific exonuclease
MKPVVCQRKVPGMPLEGIPDLLKRIYLARGITSTRQLELRLDQLLPFDALLNIEQAAERLFQAISNQQSVLIIGDYDADGATSCAVAIRGLRALGLQSVDYLVPSRFKYGYGLSAEIVEIARQYHPHLIVTVDNGITSIAGVKAARTAGIDVLVTDHHLPGEQLPEANIIVNPNQPGDTFQSKMLAGVGVMFYVLLALRALMRNNHWFEQHGQPEPNLANLLDLVALGTVADVVPLDQNNRILVEQGLRRIRAGHTHAGIRAIIQTAGRSLHQLKSADLGFAIAPRLNAAGRLEDMSLGIECLLTDDDAEAIKLARELDAINMERRAISQEMQDEAESMLRDLHISDEYDTGLPVAYCLYQPHWHQGVNGILAGRIKDKTNRPTIVFARGENGELKGSARSIAGFHIRDALEAIDAMAPGLIARFGGHAMAAGLTIAEDQFDRFASQFEAYVSSALDEDTLMHRIHTDGPMVAGDMTMQTAQALEQAGPWGQGFPEPLFEGEFSVIDQRRIGADQRHIKLKLGYKDNELDAIAFNQADGIRLSTNEQVYLTYRMDINRFRGMETLQLVVQDIIETRAS